jgi:hypothetical protein
LTQLSVHGSKIKIGSGKGLPIIKCSVCGEKIMLVPNVKLMSEAIEVHVEKHKQKVKDPKVAQEIADCVSDDLITQVLKKASRT